MAFSAHKDPEMLIEHHEDLEILKLKAMKLAELIKKSKHFIIFTGAGISTSAGIPDFRGPEGVWTLSAQGRKSTKPSVSILRALPTTTHMAIVKLIQSGYCKFLVSQNVDGLHRKSGVPPEKIAELHGNSNLEQCRKCKKQYLRDYDVSSHIIGSEHRTYRHCSVPGCNGDLYDTIINFGENLPTEVLENSFINANKADLCLVLGSSLTVAPASQIPGTVAKSKEGNLCIVNMQKTPLDGISQMRVFAKTDIFMDLVMKFLHLEVPQWKLRRNLIVGRSVNKKNQEVSVWLKGIDTDGTPVSFMKEVVVEAPVENNWLSILMKTKKIQLNKEPFTFGPFNPTEKEYSLTFTLHFMGYYQEPPLQMSIALDGSSEDRKLLVLEYDAYIREWNIKESWSLAEVVSLAREELLGEISSNVRRYSEPLPKLVKSFKLLSKVQVL